MADDLAHLDELVAAGQYEAAASLATELLHHGGRSNMELLTIYSNLLNARFRMGDCPGAVAAGDTAMRLAQELGAWDRFGNTCHLTAIAHARLGQLREAVHCGYQFLAHRAWYLSAGNHHAMVLYNLGLTHMRLGEHQQALAAFQTGLQVATQAGAHRIAHGIRHAMIEAHVEAGQLDPVPALLATCLHRIHHHYRFPADQTWLWHMDLRARFALATRRPQRAARVARRALERSEGLPDIQSQFHSILARAAHQMGDTGVARTHALLAQRFVRQCADNISAQARTEDLVYQIVTHRPDVR